MLFRSANAATLDAAALLKDFTTIALGNLNGSSESEGPVFVGGNLSSNGYGVNPDNLANGHVGGASGSLIVGGNVSGNPVNVGAGDVVIGGSTSAIINRNGGGTLMTGASVDVAGVAAAMNGLSGYLARLQARHGWRIHAADFLAARRAATTVDPAMLALSDRLAGQATLAVFSNNGRWVEGHAGDIVPALLPRFAGRVVCSGSLRRLKPEPAAYAACLARLGGEPETTLFVDDRQDNVDGARAAGLDALRFEGVETLRGELIARGFDMGDGDAI